MAIQITPRKTNVLFIIMTVLFIGTVFSNLVKDDGEQNLHVHQARAWINGKLDIDVKVNDTAIYDGKYYVTFPPFPAMLITPLVALFGDVNTTLIALFLTVALFFVMKSLFTRMGIGQVPSMWLIMAFIFGTGYWFVVKFSFGVWYFSHVVAILLLFLMIREAFGQRRAWVMAVFLGCAFLTRQLAIYSSIFVLAILLDKSNMNIKLYAIEVLKFGAVFSLFILVYLGFNYLRFDDPFNSGYYYIATDDQFLGELRYGLFHYSYIPFNFIYMFLQGPHWVFEDLKPVGMDFFGTSITFASPFVFLSLKAKGISVIKSGAWITIGLCLVHMMLYCNNGWVQINTQRFTLDFLPVLMVLLAMSVQQLNRNWIYVTVSIALFLNLISFAGSAILLRVL
jgi:hypothetical protein